MWEAESEAFGAGGREYGSAAHDRHDGVKTDGFIRRDQSCYVSTDVPSDLLVRVGDISFHLHKYPLLSRSGRMNRLLYESSDVNRVELDDLPGGPEAFELAAKFCYGVAVDLTASNISGLRCAAEYLEMTEDLEEGNLIFKTEAFLSYVVLSSWRDSIVVLKSCEGLSPWAENLQIVRRCSESIAWKACANPRGVRWAYTGKPPKSGSSPKWVGPGGEPSSKGSSPGGPPPPDWWFEDVSLLRIDHFVRVVTAIKVKGMRFDLIGAAITHYASKWLPGLPKDGTGGSSGNGGHSSGMMDDPWFSSSVAAHHSGGLHIVVAGGTGGGSADELMSARTREQRMVIESLISIIPPQKDSVPCGFLLRLLRLANMLKVAPALVTELEKRVGMQLEQASLADLLIPSYGGAGVGEGTYDVDLVQRLVEHFLVQEQTEQQPQSPEKIPGDYGGGRLSTTPPNAKMRVARLLDSYLTEVSRDRNLSLTKFQVLAEALPESARTCDDGLYRAVDSYLKAHPTLTEHERKRLCRVMDCQKLSIDACMHAAQNERLPLRVVVQVLFSEQVKISNALASSAFKLEQQSTAGDPNHHSHPNYQPMIPSRKQLLEGTPQSFQEGWAAAKKDINTLKFELESMKAKYLELQSDMDVLRRQFEKAAMPASSSSAAVTPGKKASSGWGGGWRRLSKQLTTRISGVEGQEGGHGGPGPGQDSGEMQGEQIRRPRRWRNSIS